MNIPNVCGALVLGGLLAIVAPTTASLAQSHESAAAAPKDTGASAPRNPAPNAHTNPVKDRYWRHRGGQHPHYGSRRVRT
jgi:hypothetical protein